jgi:DNA invertase Pin-like site-specific DNA recombinase
LGRVKGALRVGLYARVSTADQKTLSLQMKSLQHYAKQREWQVIHAIKAIGSGTKMLPSRALLMQAARKREIDVILVWRLDRWGRSVSDLIGTLNELQDLKVGFISITEALDFTTATGRAMAGLLAVFAEFERDLLSERVKADIADARQRGGSHGRPQTVVHQKDQVRALFAKGLSQSEIARQLQIGRSSVGLLLQKNSS